MVELKKVSKKFNSTTAVDNVSFKIGKAEVVGFLGPNGAGKTTTMRLITGFLRPSAGSVRVANLEVGENRVAVNKKIGYLAENNPLWEEMKVGEYLHFVQNVKTTCLPARQATQMSNLNDTVAVCGIGEVMEKEIGELSRGFKQRVGLAAAMLSDPPILILDEPTSGLDPNQVIEMRKLIKRLGEKKTVILSTHVLSEVAAMCNRVMIIDKGRIVADEAVPKRVEVLERLFREVTR